MIRYIVTKMGNAKVYMCCQSYNFEKFLLYFIENSNSMQYYNSIYFIRYFYAQYDYQIKLKQKTPEKKVVKKQQFKCLNVSVFQ